MKWETENCSVGFRIYETVFGTCVTHFAGGREWVFLFSWSVGAINDSVCSEAGRVVVKVCLFSTFFFPWRNSPTRARAASSLRFLDHTR
jgi:hypothetical protein